MRELSEIEKILDDDNDEDIVLYDEEDKETRFRQIAVIPIDEKIYVILSPITHIEGVNEDEGMVFSIEEIDDEDCLVIAEDPDVINEVFTEYEKLLKKAGIITD